jgi:predicted nucleotidyltransferase
MTSLEDLAAEGIDVEGIRGVLDSRPVEFALLFGSYARGEGETVSDVDVALKFPASMNDRDRFRERNRIDAALQEYAAGFVDVSDIDSLPMPVAHAAVRDGLLLAGDERELESYRKQIEAKYESTAEQRERQREKFIDRLARGDT